MDKDTKELFLKISDKYKLAIGDENYTDAFSIVYKGIESALENGNKELASSLVSLIKAIYVILADKCGVDK